MNYDDNENENQAQRAYQKLRHLLLERRLEAGSRIMEQNYAEQFQVNRGDVRMAMVRLCAEGLLVKGEKRGYFVPQLSETQIAEIYEVRMILESAAANFAAERATPEDFAELEKICDDMTMMADRGYGLGVSEADLRFHETLVLAGHNSKLTQMYQTANLPLTLSKNTFKREDPERLKQIAKEHRLILEALKRRDGQATARLLKEGLDKGNQE
jgi:DNA-binding GntR family transcriptional regulator